MGDPFKKVQPGDPIDGIPAETFNTFIDAALDFKARTRGLGQKATAQAPQRTIIPVKNLSGADRYATSCEAVQDRSAESPVAILATGRDFPDALCAAGLAGAYKAPVLLTNTNSLPASVQQSLENRGTREVITILFVNQLLEHANCPIMEVEGSRFVAELPEDDRLIAAHRRQFESEVITPLFCDHGFEDSDGFVVECRCDIAIAEATLR